MTMLHLALLIAAVALLAAPGPGRVAAQSNDCHSAPLLPLGVSPIFYNYTIPANPFPCPDAPAQICMVWRVRTTVSYTIQLTSCEYVADTSFTLRTDCNTGHFGDSTSLVYNDNIGGGCPPSATSSSILFTLTPNVDYFFSLGGPASTLPTQAAFGLGYACAEGETNHDAFSAPKSHLSTPCVTCSRGQYLPAGSKGPCSSFNCSIGTVDHDSNPATACLVAGPGNDATSSGLYGPIANFKVVAGRYDHDSNSSTPSIACPAGNYAPVGSTTCTPCSAGTWDHDGSSATACVACTACTPGSTYESTTCTATTNRVCSTCATCGQGLFASPACTVTANAACASCTSITNCTTTGLTCTSNSNQQCGLCQTGSYVTLAGLCAPCTGCGSETYQTAACNGLTDLTQCTSCTICGANQYQATPCGGTVDRTCAACATCTAGQYQSADCSPTANRVCTACTPVANCTSSVHCTTSSDSFCVDCSSCPQGQYIATACTAVLGRTCGNCTALAGCPSSRTVCVVPGHSTCIEPEENSSATVYVPIVAALGALLLVVLLVAIVLSRRRKSTSAAESKADLDITMMTMNPLNLSNKTSRTTFTEDAPGIYDRLSQNPPITYQVFSSDAPDNYAPPTAQYIDFTASQEYTASDEKPAQPPSQYTNMMGLASDGTPVPSAIYANYAEPASVVYATADTS
ncbi:hypothetical protein CAOG_06288 [Capsaspora owczarzaki ATCC 30864]|uniref:TNFR-Cys domain-containing protein n=1 Tax=Capsaspora owczarzaki (strain ATCC 30864) TaxID=595528 RepID=A0A0D2X4E0_CAPO3|nr:hypothetical protein CAOG_06288 [Capsaspora owczarzaki ATCC 30864]KJE95894.1 hypothetical protein CAOG_006288 [Capsaspora owczarzaki ATCC 30864]|eukprot:XP_004345037.2 hypothetical protein CAOG_06288 [Capsaspora owczarzaki ATCC 30864]